MVKDNDDIWVKGINYTPYFLWLIQKRQDIYNNQHLRVLRRLRKIKNEMSDNDFYLDLYLVEYNKNDGEVKSNYQRNIEGKPNRFFIDDIELMKLFD